MSLINDYFLLYHGCHYENSKEIVLSVLDEEFMCDVTALILSTNRKNFSRFFALPSYKDFLKKISNYSASDVEQLYILQYHLLVHIHESKSQEHVHKLHTAFNYLEEQGLLSGQNCQKLLSLFDPHEFHSFEETIGPDIKDNEKDFLEKKEVLFGFINELMQLGENLNYTNELNEIIIYLDKQKFSVGITGVMNAGKSTLLNALIGKEILGTSIVPETANLSLLKYSQDPYAKVFYWSKKQWKKIKESAEEFEAIALFVKESEETFKEDFDSYILEESRMDEIEVEDLSLYTSAKHNKSNLIKEIELGVNLDFLSEGIEVVDTPGLDDVVIQREEITKSYLNDCDIMIHLMNVSQSATQKDIDFIIDALLYQNVGRLLIVLTRADSVNEKELNEVIAYTRASIKSQLQVYKAQSKLEFILGSLDFIAVSSKMALLHKLGKGEEAFRQGYTLEKSGLIELESYLHNALYAKGSQKGEHIISSANKRLSSTIESQIKLLQYELRLLSKNEDELTQELEVLNLKKDENIKRVRQMHDEIHDYKDELASFAKGLESFLQVQVYRVKQRLESRLMDDFSYAIQQKKKKEFIEGLGIVLDLAFKDGLIDVLRDYRYKFIQKSQSIAKRIESDYEAYELDINAMQTEDSILELINQHFKANTLHSSSLLLASKLTKLFESSSSKELSVLQESADLFLKEGFDSLLQEIQLKIMDISDLLIQELFEKISQPLVGFEKSLEEEEKLLSDNLINYEQDEKKRDQYSLQVHEQVKDLNKALKRCLI